MKSTDRQLLVSGEHAAAANHTTASLTCLEGAHDQAQPFPLPGQAAAPAHCLPRRRRRPSPAGGQRLRSLRRRAAAPQLWPAVGAPVHVLNLRWGEWSCPRADARAAHIPGSIDQSRVMTEGGLRILPVGTAALKAFRVGKRHAHARR
eukprot:COSAG01_NODE_2137_length_8329_cov_52.487242_5_plen_148_part_00